MTVWKNARALGEAAAKAAIELAEGKAGRRGAVATKTDSGKDQPAVLLTPIGITRDNLNLVVDAKLDRQGQALPGRDEKPTRGLPVTVRRRS